MRTKSVRTCVGGTHAEALREARAKYGDSAFIISQGPAFEVSAAPASQPARVETFLGSDLNEAILNAFREFGADARIISSRELVELCLEIDDAPAAPKGGSLLGKAYGVSAQQKAPTSAASAAEGDRIRASGSSREAAAPRPAAAPEMSGSAFLGDIDRKLEEICRYARTPSRPSVSPALIELYHQMLENDVCEDIARHLVEKLNGEVDIRSLNDARAVREAMVDAISRLIPVEGPVRLRADGKPTVVAVVGPTGVGKTTSIAKLAMRFRMERRSVGLITEDTSRPAAREQLQSVAQLMSIPVAVADTVERVSDAVRKFSDRDVVLVDTAGRVPRDGAALEDLSRFLGNVQPDEVHLALCGLAGHRHVLDTIRRFAQVRFDRIIITKLDEATTYGLVLNIAAHVDKGISYVTTGQDYMADIESGDAKKLARLVLRDGDVLTRPEKA